MLIATKIVKNYLAVVESTKICKILPKIVERIDGYLDGEGKIKQIFMKSEEMNINVYNCGCVSQLNLV